MGEELIRELERAAESGSVPERAALLHELARAGGPERQARVEVAAYAGDPAARAALGMEVSVATTFMSGIAHGILFVPNDFEAFFGGFAHWGRMVKARAALAVASRLLDQQNRGMGPWLLVDAVAAWVACPCREHEVKIGERFAAPGFPWTDDMLDPREDNAWLRLAGVVDDSDPSALPRLAVIASQRLIGGESHVRSLVAAPLAAWAAEPLGA